MTEETLFHAALAVPTAERAAWLVEHCPDPELRRTVDDLLAAHDQPAGPLDSPATGAYEPTAADVSGAPGMRVGPYKLLQLIGEGGMGSVWMAEQEQPVRRRVAVKVIKPGMDSRQVSARFEAERQALALMDHPNIAIVLDAGTIGGPDCGSAGRPYFVMELVAGVPITQYCDANHLSPRERLELFVPVCQAVQHAHQKGIIHRDLKPSNVLIALYDGRPVPKVIDFGVAKATGSRLTNQTLFTEIGQIIGTLEYMAPEQAEVNNLDIDTRADIYSLGVLLYELLTGGPPFSRKQLHGAALDEMLRLIREVEPQKPSTKLSSSENLPSIAANRKLEPKRLTSLVHGDLDWIAMKCLEKERVRRYETANGLAMDIQRYLADEPVLAGPPSVLYRMRKFVRRNRGPVLAASLLILALVGGIVGTTVGLLRAQAAQRSESEQRQLADAAAEAEKEAKQAALEREAETKAVLNFVETKIFAAARPKNQEGGLGFDVKLADAVKAALPFVENSFPGQPAIEGRLRMTLGRSFSYLGNAKVAADQFDAARAKYASHLGPNDPTTLASAGSLAVAYYDLSRFADAAKLQEETLAAQKAVLGADHPDTLMTMNNLSNSYDALDRQVDALRLREETLALRKVKLGPDHHDTLMTMANLALSYYALGRYADAAKQFEDTLTLLKARLTANHPDVLRTMSNVAACYDALGRYGDAAKVKEETLELMKARLGPDHSVTLMAANNLANSYSQLGRLADALKLHKETLIRQKATLGTDHRDTLMTMHNLANDYSELGQNDDAAKLLDETLTLMRSKLGPDHPDTLATVNNLSTVYAALGRHAEALSIRQDLLARSKAKLGADHPLTVMRMANLAESLVAVNRGAEALPIIDDCLKRSSGHAPDPRLIPTVMELRLRHFEKVADAVGCRQTAEMWENLNRADANSLYTAAVMRAVAVTVAQHAPGSDAARPVNEDAERATAWLRKAVAAGYGDIPHLLADPDLAALRGRADYADLLWDLAETPVPANP
jgi:serine/threonine protein kinase/tetratricopeptide (TPR) repeat protein